MYLVAETDNTCREAKVLINRKRTINVSVLFVVRSTFTNYVWKLTS